VLGWISQGRLIGERKMQIRRLLTFLALAASPALQALNPPRSFVMKTTEPVVVSNTLLPPGSHVWRLMDSQSNLHIVQISNEATHRVEAVILAIPAYRESVTDTDQVQFWETPVGYARAVRGWFRPGESFGQEFPYSKKVVLSLGRLNEQIASAEKPMELSSHQIAKSIDKSGPTPPRAERVSTRLPEGSWAVISNGLPASVSTNPTVKGAHVRGTIWDKLRNLPLTATVAPLIGLIGAVFLLAFFLTTKRRHRQIHLPR
jgi:hypothetical protein